MEEPIVTTGLEMLGTAFSFVTTSLSGMVTTIIAQPILLLPVGIFVAGAAIGLASRLIGR